MCLDSLLEVRALCKSLTPAAKLKVGNPGRGSRLSTSLALIERC